MYRAAVPFPICMKSPAKRAGRKSRGCSAARVSLRSNSRRRYLSRANSLRAVEAAVSAANSLAVAGGTPATTENAKEQSLHHKAEWQNNFSVDFVENLGQASIDR